MNEMFTEMARKSIEHARDEAARLRHDYIGTEHLLLGLIRLGEGRAIEVITNLGLDLMDLKASIEEVVQPSGGTMTIGQLPLTARAKKTLEVSGQEARALKSKDIDTEHILLALLKDEEGIAAQVLSMFEIDYKEAYEELKNIQNGKPSSFKKKRKKSKTPALDHFGRDLTELARRGRLDPIIGREVEIQRVSQILSRRKKNNPVLIGEPGVGKTAIAEGLAQRIVEGKVPQTLEGKRVVTLDMASLVAGTKYRGQFEERLKSVMNEIVNSKDVIIFIDELHTIVGAGGAEGSLDASNIFKPALSRGELQCIGATTLNEYRKYIEKDGALDRRFQTVTVEQPTEEDTIEILKGLRGRYEDHHKITISDEAILQAVKLSNRYISGKFQPDKSIDLIDEAGARAHLSSYTKPEEFAIIESEIAEIQNEKEQSVKNQAFETAAQLRDELKSKREKLVELQKQWEDQREEKKTILTGEDIAAVLSQITGIPLFRLEEKESKRLLRMEDELKKRLVGQEEAIEAVSKAIRRARSGIGDPRRPIGSFIFLGPTGVGKTELARILAEFLFEDPDALIRVDMSEYMEKFAVSRLTGAPPGYVGYEEGGQLTEKVRRKPYSVVLLDEIEKAHPEVFNILLQLLDDGHITDSFGRKVDFKNTVVIMTSNVGTRQISQNKMVGFDSADELDYEKVKKRVTEEMKKLFNPELLNRIDETIIFHNLELSHIKLIVDILLKDTAKRLADKEISFNLTAQAKDFLAQIGYDPTYGARPLKRALQKYLEDPLAEEILKGQYNGPVELTIGVNQEEEKLTFKFSKARVRPSKDKDLDEDKKETEKVKN
ncbi:MAG: ATP-dependent Clp protease ATP-binding subunit [candidate division Zixibacteria bacterium]|nr:ATP-dependent Clp protease ATP-binding subunit [candidate division Zixibacteria bacterium]